MTFTLHLYFRSPTCYIIISSITKNKSKVTFNSAYFGIVHINKKKKKVKFNSTLYFGIVHINFKYQFEFFLFWNCYINKKKHLPGNLFYFGIVLHINKEKVTLNSIFVKTVHGKKSIKY